MEETIIHGHTVKYDGGHKGHLDLGLKYLRDHSDSEDMFRDLKNGSEPEHKGYVKFSASGYTYKLHRNNGSGYELEWKQA